MIKRQFNKKLTLSIKDFIVPFRFGEEDIPKKTKPITKAQAAIAKKSLIARVMRGFNHGKRDSS